MSIYATWLTLDDDGEHADDCESYVKVGDCTYERSGKPCTCDAWKNKPIIYEGSHVLPSEDDPRGGYIEVAEIPQHITRDGRDDAPEGELKDWLRLAVGSMDSASQRENGEPNVQGGRAMLVLTREQVTTLRDTLTEWLEREVHPEESTEEIVEKLRAGGFV